MSRLASRHARPDAPSPGSGFVVAVHDDLAPLAALWPRGAGADEAAACHVFQTADFIACWRETYGRATKARAVFVHVSEPDGTPLLLLPLTIVSQGAARVLTFLDATACDYNAPVLFPTARAWNPGMAAPLWEAVKAALPPIDLVVLEKMPAAVGDRINPLYLLSETANPESCHLNDLARPWAEIEQDIHGLRTLRKKVRALERIAPTRLVVAETAEDRSALLAVLLAQKQRRFEETEVPGFDAHPEKRAFFERATEAFAARGGLHLSALQVGTEVVACAWGLVHGRHYYGLMIGFEAGDWARHSPGRILYLELMRALHAQGCTVLDLGIGDEAWKLAQSDRTVPLRVHTEVVGWRGLAHLRLQGAVARLRRSTPWQRLRPYKWRILRSLRGAEENRGGASETAGRAGGAPSRDAGDRTDGGGAAP
ncbi:GNAT family N-acetyltransferase [Methylobacterium sp. E-041]|uniref:GNAT family N-acetyltransferase n=1 Tax=Methylobacterium sp. E-041 TaxID=2836573 RepID=UPI001FB8EC43|nr:GNAT family N-acetyltransferase [Methylobacterium sp. E-041]MCJ2105201.1 GNAT family N-acetyltransferase [Methylobacterium sp. E-041]